MRFVKGTSGNPRGRPLKGHAFAEILRAMLAEEKAGITSRERIARVVIAKALKGDMDAIKWIVDRVDGKVTDMVEAHVDRPTIDDETLDAALDYWARKRALELGAA